MFELNGDSVMGCVLRVEDFSCTSVWILALVQS